MDRLTVVDEIFLRTHRGMGTPIALQGLWRTTDAMEPVLLQAIHDRLRHGRLGRRVVNPRVPGARRAWQPNIGAHALDLLPNAIGTAEAGWSTTPMSPDDLTSSSVGPLAEHAILPWADALGTDLDPEYTPGWRLSAARLDDGGTVVAVTCSHALADARGLIHAITVALDSLGAAEPTRTSPAAEQNRPSGGKGIRATSSDWADARTQWTTIISGTARALRRGIPRSPATSTPDTSTDRAIHSTLLTFDADHWDTTAATADGTANSLFIHLIANILWHNGFPTPTIIASLPVDTRDEPRVDNDLAMTEIAIQRTDSPATIRDKAKAAYQRRISSPASLPEEILQVLPDHYAYALSKGAGERDILCSNIGTLPEAVRNVGPHNCTRVAARAIHPGITTFPRTRLAGYLSHLGDTYTLALVSLAADNDALPESIDKACAAVGLHPRPW
ncbi:hypothetical protein [Nocardia sp. XZ_19_231]|uniref:hypothetical protein n=1 Tax=Nocardia sp. XZ_19_231 TaxID=2769252 RepID=UPI001E412FEE|nr:hypothetical protein [Nocardia sp. XZ_19_231]